MSGTRRNDALDTGPPTPRERRRPGRPFCSVVALRDGHHRDLAVDVARRLGVDGDVPVTVVDVVAPGCDPLPDRDDDRGGPIAEVVGGLVGRDGVLVVIDAYGGGPIGGPLFDDGAEHVLTHGGRPTLVLGPGVLRDRRVGGRRCSSRSTARGPPATCST